MQRLACSQPGDRLPASWLKTQTLRQHFTCRHHWDGSESCRLKKLEVDARSADRQEAALLSCTFNFYLIALAATAAALSMLSKAKLHQQRVGFGHKPFLENMSEFSEAGPGTQGMCFAGPHFFSKRCRIAIQRAACMWGRQKHPDCSILPKRAEAGCASNSRDAARRTGALARKQHTFRQALGHRKSFLRAAL